MAERVGCWAAGGRVPCRENGTRNRTLEPDWNTLLVPGLLSAVSTCRKELYIMGSLALKYKLRLRKSLGAWINPEDGHDRKLIWLYL